MPSLFCRTRKSKTTGKESTNWYVGFYQEGKHRTIAAGPSKTVAQKILHQVEAEIQSGKFDFLKKPDNVKISDSITHYLDHIKALRKDRTFVRYKNAISHFQEFLDQKGNGTRVVRKLTEAKFDDYRVWRRSQSISPNGDERSSVRKPPAFRTINFELCVFRSWLNWAVIQGHIEKNPLLGLKKLKTTDSKPRRILTGDEYQRLLAASDEIVRERPTRQGQTLLWRFLANTGLRIGELTHLQWRDIDFRRQVIKIQRKPDWDPKTYEREFPFTPEAVRVLKELRTPGRENGELIFTTAKGSPVRENIARKWLLECAERAGIDDLRGPHDLRHTFITLALTEFGIDVPTVQKIVGHRNLETTQAYLHPTTDHISRSAKKFEL